MDTIQASETPLLFRLQKVYVPLFTDWLEPEKRKEKTSGKKSKRPVAEETLERRQNQKRPLTELPNLAKHRHYAVAGGPGYGKSTFVRYAALNELKEKEERLPVLLELKDFGEWLADHGGAKNPELLLAWAGQALEKVGLGEVALRARCGDGRVLWLLDGLDEIFDTCARLRAAEIIGYWFSGEGEKDGLILTGRPHAFDQDGILAALGLREHRAEVLPLDEAGQRTFLENWFAVLYGKDSPETARRHREKLWRCLQEHGRLGDLRTNPLLLSAIATVYHQGKTLPERRANLYGQAIHVLLTRRFGSAYGGSEAVVRQMHKGLSLVARYMCEQGQAREIVRLDFLDRLERGFHPERKATVEERLKVEELAEKLASHSGLLTMRGTSPQYRFSHLGFQEYLAACAFGEERDPLKKLALYLEEGSWREVVLLTAGYLFESGPSFLGLDFTKKLVKWSEGEKKSRGRLGLLLQAAVEAPKGALPEALVEDLRTRAILALANDRVTSRAKDRLVVGEGLGKLGDPRLDPRSAKRWVKVKAGGFQMGSEETGAKPVHEVEISREYWMGRYPVTNEEYGQFMEARGYERKGYWSEEGWEWINMNEGAFEEWFTRVKKQYGVRNYWKEQVRPKKEPRYWRNGKWNGRNQPVVGVSWHEAAAYCRWLEKVLGKAAPPRVVEERE